MTTATPTTPTPRQDWRCGDNSRSLFKKKVIGSSHSTRMTSSSSGSTFWASFRPIRIGRVHAAQDISEVKFRESGQDSRPPCRFMSFSQGVFDCAELCMCSHVICMSQVSEALHSRCHFCHDDRIMKAPYSQELIVF